MTADHLPAFGPAPATAPAGRRLLGRALARPSLAALVGLVVVVVFFGLQAPELLSSGGLASVLDVAALIGIGAVPVGLLLIAGQFDLSVGVVAVSSSLVAALLIEFGGWGVWPALLASLASALLVGLVNGLLVVTTGLPSFLVTLATFLVLQGVTLAGTHAVAGWLLGTLGLIRLSGVQVSPGLGSEIEFIVVAVIGGCLLTGGYGSAVGAAIGALLYAVVRQGITLAGWDPRWFQAFLGVLLLVALLTSALVRRRLKAVPRS